MTTRKVDWRKVDWRLQDTVIARMHGCSHQRVHQKRVALGKPRSPATKRPQKSAMLQLERLSPAQTRRKTSRQLADTLGISANYARSVAMHLALPLKVAARTPRRPLLQRWNWDLGNADLARIWLGKATNATLSYASRHRPRPARWDCRFAVITKNPAYRRALAREKQRAAAFITRHRAAASD